MNPRPTFVLCLRPKKGINPIHALRRGLKFLLRSCGLQALSVEEIPEKGMAKPPPFSGMRADAPSSAVQTREKSHD
jgi:hypothetical protein